MREWTLALVSQALVLAFLALQLVCSLASSRSCLVSTTSSVANSHSLSVSAVTPLSLTVFRAMSTPNVTVPTVTLTRKVGPGLRDLQTRARRILAEKNAEKAEENTWIGRMVAAESLKELETLVKSRGSTN